MLTLLPAVCCPLTAQPGSLFTEDTAGHFSPLLSTGHVWVQPHHGDHLWAIIHPLVIQGSSWLPYLLRHSTQALVLVWELAFCPENPLLTQCRKQTLFYSFGPDSIPLLPQGLVLLGSPSLSRKSIVCMYPISSVPVANVPPTMSTDCLPLGSLTAYFSLLYSSHGVIGV